MFTKLISKIQGRLTPALVFYILLFISNIAFIPALGITIRDGRELVIQWGIMLLIGIYLSSLHSIGCPYIRLNKTVALFMIWCLASMIMNCNPFSQAAMFNVLLFTILFYMVKNIADKWTIPKIMNVICGSVLFQVAWCIMQYFDMDPIFSTLTGRGLGWCVGFLDNSDLIAAFIGITFPLFLRRKWAYLTPVVILPLLQQHTKGGFVALFAGVLFWLVFNGWSRKAKAVWLVIIGILVCGYVFVLSHPMSFYKNERVTIFKQIYHVSNHVRVHGKQATYSQKIAYKESIVGYGLGRFKMVWPVAGANLYGYSTTYSYLDKAHNDWLQVKFELGWIGLLIVAGFLITLFMSFFNSQRGNDTLIIMSGVVAVMVNAFVNFPFHCAGLAFIAVTYLAIANRMVSHGN